MAMRVLGLGFGRTGTLSLKQALEELGAGPCYHMTEVFQSREHIDRWHRILRGERPDWAAIFAGYRATVDWPACTFWRELIDAFPEAPVLLSVRDPAVWHESMERTIFAVLSRPPMTSDPDALAHHEMAKELILDRTFGGKIHDREHVIDVYLRHNEAIRTAVEPSRLLEYEVGDGWQPLCDLLGAPVPSGPFPRVNSTDDFRTRFRLDEPPSRSDRAP